MKGASCRRDGRDSRLAEIPRITRDTIIKIAFIVITPPHAHL